jgi:hypothetical protein
MDGGLLKEDTRGAAHYGKHGGPLVSAATDKSGATRAESRDPMGLGKSLIGATLFEISFQATWTEIGNTMGDYSLMANFEADDAEQFQAVGSSAGIWRESTVPQS